MRHRCRTCRAPIDLTKPNYSKSLWRQIMQMHIALQPLVALIAGILILMIPRLLNYIVAIYLIVIGILGLVRM